MTRKQILTRLRKMGWEQNVHTGLWHRPEDGRPMLWLNAAIEAGMHKDATEMLEAEQHDRHHQRQLERRA